MKLFNKFMTSSLLLTTISVPTILMSSCSKNVANDFVDLNMFDTISVEYKDNQTNNTVTSQQYAFVGNANTDLINQDLDTLKTKLNIELDVPFDSNSGLNNGLIQMIPKGYSISYIGLSTSIQKETLDIILSTNGLSFISSSIIKSNQMINLNDDFNSIDGNNIFSNIPIINNAKRLNKSDTNLNIINNDNVDKYLYLVEATNTLSNKTIKMIGVSFDRNNGNWSNNTNYPITLMTTDLSSLISIK